MLNDYADLLLDTMVTRDPSKLPLADRYAATENSVAGALHMMTFWRSVTGINRVGQYIVDESAGQIFFTASLNEGGSSTAFWARLKVVDEQLTELEMYNARSAADGGYVLHADEIGVLPEAWTSPIPMDLRATRDELLQVGRAIFDTSISAPETSPDLVLMESGGVVHEHREYVDLLATGELHPHEPGETVTLNIGLPDFRPTDPQARVAVVDEEQGVVVAIAVVPGFVSPTLTSDMTKSAFVPAAMIDMHNRTLLREWLEGRQVLLEMPATSVTCQVIRFHSGLIQGSQLWNRLQGPGAGTPWAQS